MHRSVGLMTRGWRQNRTIRTQRLGEFFASRRVASGVTLKTIEDAARQDGERLNDSSLNRVEMLRLRPPQETLPPRTMDIMEAMYLCHALGFLLADVEAYMMSEDDSSVEPSVKSRANALRQAYLGWTPERREQLDHYLQYLLYLDSQET